jgi:hypothetical protein
VLHPMLAPEPKACNRFKDLPPTEAFFKHLSSCEACKAVIEFRRRDGGLRAFIHAHRN